MELTRLWVGAIGLLVGAIAGAWVWAQRAAALTRQAAGSGEDALVNTAQTLAAHSVGAALQGALVGGLIGLAIAVAYLYFTDPDRGMKVRRIDVHDD